MDEPTTTLRPILPGELQLTVLGALWRERRLNLYVLHGVVNREYKPIALSTLSTTLTRLIERGWIERTSAGMYKAALTRQGLIDLLTEKINDA